MDNIYIGPTLVCTKTNSLLVSLSSQLHSFVRWKHNRPCAFLQRSRKNQTEKLPKYHRCHNKIKDRVRNNSSSKHWHKNRETFRIKAVVSQCSLSLCRNAQNKSTRDWWALKEIVVYIHTLDVLSAQFNYACCVLILCKWISRCVCRFGMLLLCFCDDKGNIKRDKEKRDFEI